jgi:nicotinamidase/pyrazinamidase
MKAVFFDVDTQIDFLFPAGALYVPGAENIVENVVRLNRYAADHRIPIVSDMDAHSEDDPEFHSWPAHCVKGTVGQLKPQATLVGTQTVIPFKQNGTLNAFDVNATQILLEKRTLDCFSNPYLPELLERLHADRYVVYGVVTEICVRYAAFGLLNTRKHVEIVTDAVRSLNAKEAEQMLSEFTARGGFLTTTKEVLST